MHELGIVYEIIKIVDKFTLDNNLTRVEKIILEIGELSQAIPRYIEECYPAAIDGTPYEDTILEIVILPADVKCRECNEIYNVIKNKKICPKCSGSNYDLLTGEEFSIREIIAC